MKTWIGRILLVLALPLTVVVCGGLWIGYKIMLYQQQDNLVHLTAKHAYLEQLAQEPVSGQRPNIIFILFDDLGHGDLGNTGSKAIATPTIDELAEQGVTLANFYSPAPSCTPARAGYLTGRFPLRAGLPAVVFPTGSPINLVHKVRGVNLRLPAEEITLADALQAAGYRTGMVGKWHMGDRSPSLPNDMGFQSYYGALYSNDMTPFALYPNRQIEVQAPADQTLLNERYAAEAVRFIEDDAAGQPFFLYYAHNFPHIPLYAGAVQEGRSRAGLYGDVVEGLDWGVAQIVEALKARGIYDDTLIIITSDNGPWYQGSPGTDRGRKGDTFEGGMHVPFIVHWPAQITGGQRFEGLSMGIDLFPTILDWLELPLPGDRRIDGASIRNMLAGAESPHDYLYYFADQELMAIRDGEFKYHAPRTILYGQAGQPFSTGPTKGPWLFDMRVDENESYDVSMTQLEDTARLAEKYREKQQEMQENLRGWIE